MFFQDYKDYEIIIIDQSDNDQTDRFVNSLNSEKIIYEHVNFRGLSKARNYAITMAKGDFICLTDDDAYYPPNYLTTLKKHFSNNCSCIISGYIWNTIDKKDYVEYSKMKNGDKCSVRDILRYCPSACITIPRHIFEMIGVFDPEFGVGAHYGAAEESDVLLRAKWEGYEIIYYSDVRIDHPHKKLNVSTDDESKYKKAKSYSFGTGAVYKKHLTSNFNIELLLTFLEYTCRLIIKKILHYKFSEGVLNSFLAGFREYEIEDEK